MPSPFSSEQPPIPGYEPVRLLGMNLGAIYLARHSRSGTLVALKVSHREFAAHFRDLHAPLARLDHPNIVRVLGMGEFEGNFFCALEYVERTLADRLLEGPLSGVEVARLAHAVGSALQYARDQGMIPLSLTPKSIVLTDENVPKLSNFCSMETFGKLPKLPSPALMPPEWVSSGIGSASETTQVYRVGALMYEMLTARPPFAADYDVATLKRVLNDMPEPPRQINPKVGRDLEVVCMKCLAKPPEARYASLRELVDHLKPFVGSTD